MTNSLIPIEIHTSVPEHLATLVMVDRRSTRYEHELRHSCNNLYKHFRAFGHPCKGRRSLDKVWTLNRVWLYNVAGNQHSEQCERKTASFAESLLHSEQNFFGSSTFLHHSRNSSNLLNKI